MTEQNTPDNRQKLLAIAETIYVQEIYPRDPDYANRSIVHDWTDRSKGALTTFELRIVRGVAEDTAHYVKSAIFKVYQKRRITKTMDEMHISVSRQDLSYDKKTETEFSGDQFKGVLFEPFEYSDDPYKGAFAGNIARLFQAHLDSRPKDAASDDPIAA